MYPLEIHCSTIFSHTESLRFSGPVTALSLVIVVLVVLVLVLLCVLCVSKLKNDQISRSEFKA